MNPFASRMCAALGACIALSAALPAQTIDLVGSNANAPSGAARAKGNAYSVSTSVTLDQAEFELNFTTQQTLRFTVHESATEMGTYTEVFSSSALVTGVGQGYYSSGPINVPLNASTFYIIAVSWSGTLTYYYGTGNSQPVSFGAHEHGHATGTHPLPISFSSNSNDVAIYSQRLTTSPPAPPVTTYCTAGTTSSGCVPAISGSGAPSASFASAFTIDVADVEGQKQGLIFYGIDNTGFTPLPWGTSTSFFCVKPPTQRTPAQLSGGTVNACDGALTLDWNAYQIATPGALGQPFLAGQHVYAQGWFRDPPSPKTTMFSDALEFVLAP